jgi:hypothetical protein
MEVAKIGLTVASILKYFQVFLRPLQVNFSELQVFSVQLQIRCFRVANSTSNVANTLLIPANSHSMLANIHLISRDWHSLIPPFSRKTSSPRPTCKYFNASCKYIFCLQNKKTSSKEKVIIKINRNKQV